MRKNAFIKFLNKSKVPFNVCYGENESVGISFPEVTFWFSKYGFMRSAQLHSPLGAGTVDEI